jgi:hypothetical protein
MGAHHLLQAGPSSNFHPAAFLIMPRNCIVQLLQAQSCRAEREACFEVMMPSHSALIV